MESRSFFELSSIHREDLIGHSESGEDRAFDRGARREVTGEVDASDGRGGLVSRGINGERLANMFGPQVRPRARRFAKPIHEFPLHLTGDIFIMPVVAED